MKKVLLLTCLILFFDQGTKIFIKTHFEMRDSLQIFPWFFLSFVENPGMAYGLHLGPGYMGKIVLSCLRLFLSIGIFLWIYQQCKKGASNYFIVPMSIIFAGAIGNLIDSTFYGLIFDRGIIFDKQHHRWLGYEGIARFGSPGYSFFMGGAVVDMLYFPIIDNYLPDWIPYFGGKRFEFFKPVFNLADAFISIGGILMIIFGNKVFKPIESVKNS